MITLLLYRLYQLKRAFWRTLGRCHRCRSRLNYTPFGRGICPECGR